MSGLESTEPEQDANIPLLKSNESRLKGRWYKLIIILAVVSFVLTALYQFSGFLYRKDRLPFGFYYQAIIGNKDIHGNISYINPEKVAEVILPGLGDIKLNNSLLIFRTTFIVDETMEYALHLSPQNSTKLYIDSKQIPLNVSRYYSSVTFTEGRHDLIIHYVVKSFKTDKIRFVITEKEYPTVSFHRFVLPNSESSKAMATILNILEQIKNYGFFCAFLIVVILLMITFSHTTWLNSGKRAFVFQFILLEGCCLFISILLVLLFINYFFAFSIPDVILILLSFGCTLLILKMTIQIKEISWRIQWDTILVIIAVSILVFYYVFLNSGLFFPMKQIGTGDIETHLLMIDHIKNEQSFFKSGWGPIYPQSLHAFIAMLCNLSGLTSRQLITMVLCFMSISLISCVYCLGKLVIKSLEPGTFIVVLGLSNIFFVMYTILNLYSFPAAFAIMFFLLSLLFILKRRLVTSSLLFTAALLSYPYFVLVFGIVLTLFLTLLSTNSWKDPKPLIYRLIFYFLVPFFYMLFYFFVFIKVGYAQQQQGFDTPYKLNPFDFLSNINALLVLAGLAICFFKRKSKELFLLALSVTLGFLVYYVPYCFFSSLTAYYLMKNMIYLILFGIIFEMVTVTEVINRFALKTKGKVIFLFISLLVVCLIFYIRLT